MGSLTLEVTEDISPLKDLVISMELSYKNSKGDAKMNTTHKPVPSYVAGVPVFSLKLNSSTNQIGVGGRAKFFFKVLLRKMKSTLEVEVQSRTACPIKIFIKHSDTLSKSPNSRHKMKISVFVPTIYFQSVYSQVILPVNETSIMAITYVKVVSVGKNIDNYAALKLKEPKLNSTVKDPKLHDRATIDFGTVKSVVGLADSPDNEIVIEFEIVVNDHPNVTNGSKHWVGVGVRGGERMIWIGEVALMANVPDDRRPVLKVTANCYIPQTQEPCETSTKLSRL